MPLPVQLLAMSPSSQKIISGFIKTKGKEYFSISNASAPVIIMDIDNPEGRSLLAQHRDSSKSIITLSLTPSIASAPTSNKIIQLQKPITGVELIRAAEKINKNIKNMFKKNMFSANPKSNNEINKNTTENRLEAASVRNSKTIENTSYDPSTTLQGVLRKAIQMSEQDSSLVIIEVQNYRLQIDPKSEKVVLNFSTNKLRNLCYFPLNPNTYRIEKISQPDAFIAESTFSIKELSWTVALLCSRGRLAKNLNDNTLFQLKAWPNLTRWQTPDHALSIAGLWSKSPQSILSITQNLNIPITHARSFIIAALDSHLAFACEQKLEVAQLEENKSNNAFFKKLLNRLKRA